MVNVLGKPIVVINSEKAAIEIMEKRSAISTDRPPIPLMDRLVSFPAYVRFHNHIHHTDVVGKTQ